MARRFGDGHPSLREALKKLETMGVVEIRHGSGVYVTRNDPELVVAAPDYAGTVTKKLLLDLIEARLPLEVLSVTLATRNAEAHHLTEMRRLLDTARETVKDDLLNVVNMSFHRVIAVASDNTVVAQLINVMAELFVNEQRLILRLHSRTQDDAEHLGILAAIEARDEGLAVERMTAHLNGVIEAIEKWDPPPATA
jgi:GntR family transcriptional repressor for pyruvate dehydrogenase complex